MSGLAAFRRLGWRRWGWLPLLLLVAVGARCPGGAKARKAPRAAVPVIPDSADQLIFGLRTIMQDRGVNRGVLLADSALVYEEGTRLELLRVHVTFHTGSGVKDGVLTSRQGTYNARLSRLEARGDVVIVREDGKRLTSPQLVYDQARNQVFSDSAFVLTEPRRQISGIGFESDPRLTNFRCMRNCKGVAPVKVPTR
ncbi:MAG: LPS export ABC transporter periplasmic protein LptC [Gemmatimonadetes bacterium]|nr:LPS export ABC transporter periplasmic protein LptC [Gemmatimonadota bacterium]